MPDIVHRLRVSAPAPDVFRELTEAALLAGAWSDVSLRVVERDEGSKIVWRCEAGPAEWIGTEIAFDLAPDGRETVMVLAHRHWREATSAMADSTTRWARVLFGLKARVEAPEPDDVLLSW